MLRMLPKPRFAMGSALTSWESACRQSPIDTSGPSLPGKEPLTGLLGWWVRKDSRKYKQWSHHSLITDHNQQLRLALWGVPRLSGEKEVEWKTRLWEEQACSKGPQGKGISSQLSRALGEPANQHQTPSWAHGSFFMDWIVSQQKFVCWSANHPLLPGTSKYSQT